MGHIETIFGEKFPVVNGSDAERIMFGFIKDTGVPCRLVAEDD